MKMLKFKKQKYDDFTLWYSIAQLYSVFTFLTPVKVTQGNELFIISVEKNIHFKDQPMFGVSRFKKG